MQVGGMEKDEILHMSMIRPRRRSCNARRRSTGYILGGGSTEQANAAYGGTGDLPTITHLDTPHQQLDVLPDTLT
jgi:hypothetical protein